MINEVTLEGIVVREPWKFMDDLFFRQVIYRDSDLPTKKLDLERDTGDYTLKARRNAPSRRRVSPLAGSPRHQQSPPRSAPA